MVITTAVITTTTITFNSNGFVTTLVAFMITIIITIITTTFFRITFPSDTLPPLLQPLRWHLHLDQLHQLGWVAVVLDALLPLLLRRPRQPPVDHPNVPLDVVVVLGAVAAEATHRPPYVPCDVLRLEVLAQLQSTAERAATAAVGLVTVQPAAVVLQQRWRLLLLTALFNTLVVSSDQTDVVVGIAAILDVQHLLLFQRPRKSAKVEGAYYSEFIISVSVPEVQRANVPHQVRTVLSDVRLRAAVGVGAAELAKVAPQKSRLPRRAQTGAAADVRLGVGEELAGAGEGLLAVQPAAAVLLSLLLLLLLLLLFGSCLMITAGKALVPLELGCEQSPLTEVADDRGVHWVVVP